MIELPDITNIPVDIDTITNKLITKKNVSVSILRLDKIHPEISGNKFFKLYFFLQQAIREQKKIITFGGAYSNHLAATAYACNVFGIACTGIVRGEEPKKLSHTLSYCIKQGMHLEFITRTDYNKKVDADFQRSLDTKYGRHILIPEGGYSKTGVAGAALIGNLLQQETFTHICCAVGTATTLGGLIETSRSPQQVIGFSALKSLPDFEQRIQYLTGKKDSDHHLVTDYHFGGYAKFTEELIFFMNEFYEEHAVPLDFVYTGKMMFGVLDLIKKDHFVPGSNIICLHTGGLQGNISLPAGTFNF